MLYQILITIGASQALALGILLLLKRQRQPGDQLLSFVLMLMFLIIMLFNYRYELLLTRLPLCLHSFTLAYLVLPAFYQYIKIATHGKCQDRWQDVLPHYLPFIGVVSLMAIFYLPMPFPQQRELYDSVHSGSGPLWFLLIYYGLFLIMFPVYIWLTLRELQKHEHYVLTCFSYTEEISLGWLNRFIWAVGVVWLGFVLFEVVGGPLYRPPLDELGINLAFILFVVCISYLGLYGLRHQTIFLDPLPEHLRISPGPELPKDQIQNIELAPTDAVMLAQLREIMNQQQPHRRPRLTLNELAELCGWSPHQLSRLINEAAGQHFFDFVNGYRVKTFQQLVADPENTSYTLLALAYEAGFNSKSTFNAFFKKTTGLTPSAYVRQLTKKPGISTAPSSS